MIVHIVNAGTLDPQPPEAWGGAGAVCRCLLIDTGDRLIAVDTGIGLADIADPVPRLGADWLAMARPALDPAEALVNQVARLGRTVDEATDVLLTHGHRDHVGGLADLPHARVHGLPGVREAVERAQAGVGPEPSPLAQWRHGVRWAATPAAAGSWRGLSVHRPDGLPDGILLVELPGHAVGHAGVLVDRGDHGWLLHVGDAVFHPAQYTGGPVPPGVVAFTEATQQDAVQRSATEKVLGRLAQADDVTIVSSHGPVA